MQMILSKTCDYAMRAAFYIAAQNHNKFVPIREMSEELDISFHFLTKILQILNQKNIVVSFKGPNGGVALACPAKDISLTEIVEAIDGASVFYACLLGLDECGDENPCPMHFQWGPIRDQIKEIFDHTSLKDIFEKLNTNEFRITNILKQSVKKPMINFG